LLVIRNQGLVVFLVQLVKRLDAMPFTRDYMCAEENASFNAKGTTRRAVGE
jgi:hypothetical protein